LYAWKREIAAGVWLADLKQRDNLEDVGVEDNINMDLKEMGWEGMDWGLHGLGWGQVADCCRQYNEP
jgi:hypothetical protein